MSLFNELKASLSKRQSPSSKSASQRHAKPLAMKWQMSAIRAALNVSQQEMADALGTSVDTIKSWESRRRNPTGLAAKVLATIADNPSLFRELAAH